MKKHTIKKLHLSILAGALALASCSGNTTTNNQETAVNETKATVEYTWNQKLFCLNMLSNISGAYGKEKDITDSTIWAVNTVLGDPTVQQYIGTWTCVWGPRVVYSETKHIPANTMFIARQGTTNNYVVAIAGTDPASNIAKLLEDANIFTPPPFWEYGTGHPMARISQGTADGLKALKLMKDSSKGSARDFLSSLVKDRETINIWVTGHSLGGFLSPTYALYLHDTKNEWAKKGTVNINCLAVAGATPGNQAFSDYYNKQLGKTTIRVWNMLDVVPHAYEPGMLAKITTLYSGANPADTLPSKIGLVRTDTLIQGLINVSKIWNYTQLYPSTVVGFTSDMYTMPADTSGYNGAKANTFFGQTMAQHIPAYATFFGVDSFQYAVMRAAKLAYPFFSYNNTMRTAIKTYDTTDKNFNNMNPY